MSETPEEIFAQLNISKILIAILEEQGQVVIPTARLINAISQDKDLQVDYDADTLTFTFRLREKPENTEVVTDGE